MGHSPIVRKTFFHCHFENLFFLVCNVGSSITIVGRKGGVGCWHKESIFTSTWEAYCDIINKSIRVSQMARMMMMMMNVQVNSQGAIFFLWRTQNYCGVTKKENVANILFTFYILHWLLNSKRAKVLTWEYFWLIYSSVKLLQKFHSSLVWTHL